MDHLQQEVIVINGKKLRNCTQLLLFFHLLFVLMIAAFCTYHFREVNRFHLSQWRRDFKQNNEYPACNGRQDS